MKPRMQLDYESRVAQEMMGHFSYENPMQVPRLVKIVLNMGVGDATQNAKSIDAATEDLGRIAGQRPAIRRANISP